MKPKKTPAAIAQKYYSDTWQRGENAQYAIGADFELELICLNTDRALTFSARAVWPNQRSAWHQVSSADALAHFIAQHGVFVLAALEQDEPTAA